MKRQFDMWCVEININPKDPGNHWIPQIGSWGNQSYSTGYYHGLVSVYNRGAVRLVNKVGEVVEMADKSGMAVVSSTTHGCDFSDEKI